MSDALPGRVTVVGAGRAWVTICPECHAIEAARMDHPDMPDRPTLVRAAEERDDVWLFPAHLVGTLFGPHLASCKRGPDA